MTCTASFPTASDDLIDSRDVIEWIETLTEDAAGGEEIDEDALTALVALADEASGYSEDWEYGATLIRETYFTEYAKQLADDVGAIDRNASWPLCHIDWEAAADSLAGDYTTVSFAGVDYYVR